MTHDTTHTGATLPSGRLAPLELDYGSGPGPFSGADGPAFLRAYASWWFSVGAAPIASLEARLGAFAADDCQPAVPAARVHQIMRAVAEEAGWKGDPRASESRR